MRSKEHQSDVKLLNEAWDKDHAGQAAEITRLGDENEKLREALQDLNACGLIMSNVCWSLGHKDREVGDRQTLASLANRWDALGTKYRVLLRHTGGTDV